jgi:hypothetical protein
MPAAPAWSRCNLPARITKNSNAPQATKNMIIISGPKNIQGMGQYSPDHA